MSMRRMQAEIITVGDELLNGRTENTNASFLCRELQSLGFNVSNQTTVADRTTDIVQALMTAVNRSNVIVFTGGLGPTDHDLTKETVAKALGMALEEDADTLERIRAFFESRGREMKDNNRKQALIPVGAEILENENGTAPGVYIRKDEQIIILLPGPPSELRPMFTEKAAPRLSELSGQKIFCRTLGVTGMGESELEVKIKDRLYGEDPNAALYAKEGEIEICVTSFGDTEEEAESKGRALIEDLKAELGDLVYTENGETLAEATVRRLLEKKQTVALAESCTGGMIAQMITDIPGSSDAFEYGLTSYGDWVKNASLGVDNSLIKKYTAISSAVAAEMARGARKNGRATYGIGVTGIAGPGVGTYLDKEVGLVYIAVCDRKKTVVKEFRFGDKRNRDNIRRLSAKNAFDMLRLFMDGHSIEGGSEFKNRMIADLEHKENPRRIAGLFVKKAVSIIVAGGVAVTAGYYGIRTVQAMSDRRTYEKLESEYYPLVTSDNERSGAFRSLIAENNDFRGVICNESGDIKSVVVEGREDGYYTGHDFFRGTNRLGCSEVTSGPSAGGVPSNLSIESSGEGKNVLFNHLNSYRDINYARKNSLLTYYGTGFIARYRVIAAFLLDSGEGLDDVFYKSDLSGREDYFEYVMNLKMRSFYDSNYAITDSERFITLSAPCDDWDGAVLVVCGVLADEGEESRLVYSENSVALYPASWYEERGAESGINVTAERDRWYEWVVSNSTPVQENTEVGQEDGTDG